MRKEVILAVIIGVILGGVILYGINLANNSVNSNPDKTETEGNNPKAPQPSSKKPASQIVIDFPQENSVITENSITLKGSAKPNSAIAIITESDDIIVTADSEGNFSSPINLIVGENNLAVTSIDEKQATASATISVIHTTSLPE